MIFALFFPALAAPPEVDATVFVGGRTAPESAIQVPSAWEGTFEPSGLISATLRGRFGARHGPWARLELGGWGYGPDVDASLATGGVGVGWRALAGETFLEAAGRYDGQVFPLLFEASNGRGELLLRAGTEKERWGLTGQLVGVDRRFVGTTGFDTAELGGTLSLLPGGWGVNLGLSGQGNAAASGQLGAQARTLLGLWVGGETWRIAAEHRLIWAFEGEVDEEVRAAFTPVGDYADDVDALSGGGFLQNRIALHGVVTAGSWMFSGGGLLRLRGSEEEEETRVAFTRAWNAQARVDRLLTKRLTLFVSGGAAGATLGTGKGFVDGFGWVGMDLRLAGSPLDP